MRSDYKEVYVERCMSSDMKYAESDKILYKYQLDYTYWKVLINPVLTGITGIWNLKSKGRSSLQWAITFGGDIGYQMNMLLMVFLMSSPSRIHSAPVLA